MSEPKAAAAKAHEIVPGIFHISIKDERIHHVSEAYALSEGGRVTLVDPVRLEKAALAGLGAVAAVVIASPSHQRSAWRYQKEAGARVHAPAGAKGLEGTPDATFKDGDRLPGGLRAVHAPGPAAAHYALLLDRGPGVLFVTDLLMHEPDRGIVFLPDKYLDDPAAARTSARRLADLRFEVLCFGHGEPVKSGGRRALEEVLLREGQKGGA